MNFQLQETVWIRLSDGVRLAATIWMPDGPGPFPAVLEYLPYRRGDGTAPRDDSTYPTFAREGIVGVRVDSRGQGDSEGLFDDEYSPLEMADCCEVIAWIAAQDWSNGAVGMMGISWGGFNGLQVAALRPPALKAVISIASTSDRYNDDIHYKGGCLLSANVYWAGTMLSYSSRPPDPDVVGNRWAEIWRERLEAEPLLLETWLRHHHRDAYWQHGSICEDWGAIQCPVWVIAGWADGYRNTPAALAANLHAPVKAMTGPWVHKYPHFAWPKPRADFLGMATDWWHHWLSGEDRAVEAWPGHAAFVIENARPSTWRGEDAGRWVAATPGAMQRLPLGADGVLGSKARGDVLIATPQHCGTASGEYFTLAPNADMAADQRADDALSVCWERAVDADMTIIGRPVVEAKVTIDQPQGNLIARLMDVHPDGTSTLIARGVLNLCHRDGNADPQPMPVGQAVSVRVTLDETAYRVLPGHRLRLALSTAYWPLVLPSPAPVQMVVSAGASALEVPIADSAQEITIPEPADPDPLPKYPVLVEGSTRREVQHDLSAGRVRYRIWEDSGLTRIPRNGMECQDTRDEMWEIDPADPTSCRGTLSFTTLRQRGAWSARTEAQINFRMTATTWQVEASLTAWNGEEVFVKRDWAFTVDRRMV